MIDELELDRFDPAQSFEAKQADAQRKLLDEVCAAQRLTVQALKAMPAEDVAALVGKVKPGVRVDVAMLKLALDRYGLPD